MQTETHASTCNTSQQTTNTDAGLNPQTPVRDAGQNMHAPVIDAGSSVSPTATDAGAAYAASDDRFLDRHGGHVGAAGWSQQQRRQQR